MTQLLKNKHAASPQRMPYACREAPAPLGRTVPCLGQGQLQVFQEGEQQWGPGTAPSAWAAIGKRGFTLQENSCHSLQPNEPKASPGEKHFWPQERCEIFLKVSSSKWYFWSSQLLGGEHTCDSDTARAQCHTKEIWSPSKYSVSLFLPLKHL